MDPNLQQTNPEMPNQTQAPIVTTQGTAINTLPVPVASTLQLQTEKVKLRHGKVGFSKKVTLIGYSDHVEIHDKSGQILLNAPYNQLENLNFKSTYFVFNNQGKYYSLDFLSVFAGMFGLVGAAIFGLRAKKKLDEWKQLLQRMGAAPA